MRWSTAVIAAAMGTSLVAAGCSGSSGGGSGGADGEFASGGTFTMVLTDDLDTLDPYLKGPRGWEKLVYDSLINLKADGSIASGLAEKWSATATTATFTLREGVTCSDGTPLTAGQVATDLNFVSDPKNKSTQYGVNTPTVPLKVTGDDASRTVTVTVSSPFGFLLQAIGQVPIVCPKGMQDRAMLAKGADGTGPFTLTNVVPSQSYTFKVRKDYAWGPDGAKTSVPGMPETVVLRVVTNETTAANLLLSGEVNLARITGDDQQRLAAEGLKKFEEPLSGAWLWFNQRDDHPTTDKRVRQALVSALDLEEVVKVNTGGNGSAASGLVTRTPRFCARDTVSGKLPKQDAAAAGALLDQAGWVKGADGVRAKGGKPLTISIHYSPAYSSSYEKPTAELLAQQWTALGAKVEQTSDTRAGFGETQKNGNFDVYIQGYFLYLPSQLVAFASGRDPSQGGQNFAGIDNKQYAALAAKAVTMTPPEACDYWAQAEQAIIADLDIAPIANRPRPWYLKNAQAESVAFDIPVPTSIRLLTQ